jgi:hypothetical protein
MRALRGFDRVDLKFGETRHLSIRLEERSLQYSSEAAQKWVTNSGCCGATRLCYDFP